jgi:hypothetical protein
MGQDERDEDGKSQALVSAGTVRGRVIRHLRGLLLPGVLGLGACKETSSVVCDPMPPPTGTSTAGLPTTSTETATTPPVVCDPMPPPPPTVSATATTTTRPATTSRRTPVVCDPMPPPPPKK